MPFHEGFKTEKTGASFTIEQIDQLCAEFEARQKQRQQQTTTVTAYSEKRLYTIILFLAVILFIVGLGLLEATKIIIFGHW